MTTQTTRELAREVAEALVSMGKLKHLFPHADYPHDLNACARDLTREGYYPNLAKTEDGWCVVYQIDYNHYIINTRKFAKEPAVAWCESFLALQKYVKGEG